MQPWQVEQYLQRYKNNPKIQMLKPLSKQNLIICVHNIEAFILYLQKYYSTRQGYIKACTSCGETSWFNWRIVAPAPSDQYRIIGVSDCKRNTSFGLTLTRGTSVQNTFKPYYSRWVFKIMCTRGYDDSCLIERCVASSKLTINSSACCVYPKQNPPLGGRTE